MRVEEYTGRGGYRTQKGFSGFGNWSGVKVTTLINTIQSIPNQYSLRAFSQEGYNMNYSYSTIIGNIDIYNPNNESDSNPIGKVNRTMVLAYQYEGKWLNTSNDGNLRIVFLDEQGSITDSKIWMKMVVSIRIITE